MRKDIYESPLSSRYASEYMLHLFSPDMRFQTWRRLWVALARAEHELGLDVAADGLFNVFDVAAGGFRRSRSTSSPRTSPTSTMRWPSSGSMRCAMM